jgi:hypothetical protein
VALRKFALHFPANVGWLEAMAIAIAKMPANGY